MKIDILKYKLRSISDDELNEILNIRDANREFEELWLKLAEETKSVNIEFDGEERFVELSKITGGHEICSYIIEDLELIEKADAISLKSSFLTHLVKSYRNGEVPHSLKHE